MSRNLLLINPWAYDFAAHDLWARPLGFLYIAAILRRAGFRLFYIDCMDRAHPRALKTRDKPFGCGKYHQEVIDKPKSLSWVKRRYKRYGLPLRSFVQELSRLPRPDAILITSRMTYWYPAIMDAVRLCRQQFPSAPIILGGTYVTLCPDHAREYCKPDYMLEGECEYKVLHLLSSLLRCKLNIPSTNASDLDELPYPAYDLLYSRSALPILTSRGCPMRCTYCASRILFPSYRQRNPQRIADEIVHHHNSLGTQDFAFYDDALLADPARFEHLLDCILDRGIGVNFHCPNGLDYTAITPQIARKMFQSGFKTLRLSLETKNPERLRQLRRSQPPEALIPAVGVLRAAGFRSYQIGVYIMFGLPYQNESEVRETIDFVLQAGATPRLTEYSPIPGTSEWQRAVENARKDIAEEPLLHNNSIYCKFSRAMQPGALERLKIYIRNQKDGKSHSRRFSVPQD